MSSLDFHYVHKPISKLESLATTLKLSYCELIELVQESNGSYVLASKEPKSDGTIRLTYKAKPKLRKALDLLRERVFSGVIYPDYILAGQPKKSYIDNSLIHIGSVMLLAEDVKNFFPSISVEKVEGLFQYFFNFSPEVAKALAELCTKDGFVVQGSPISGDIANLIFFGKEPAFVEWCHQNNLRYTRYYDDIHVSSENGTFYEKIGELKEKIYGMFGYAGVRPHRGKKKSHIAKRNSRVSVHDVTVNSHKLSPSKKRLAQFRKQVYIFEKSIINKEEIGNIIKQYKSISGLLQTLKQQGYIGFKRKSVELNRLIFAIDEADAKKYARKYRKCKSQDELRGFSGEIAVLKKINPRVKMVVQAEKNSIKKKLCHPKGIVS